MISNIEFLQAIFGDSYIYAHVTSFIDDPSNIPNERRAKCWAGGYYKDTPLTPSSNQFYTVSLFSADSQQKSRRRKAHFAGTYVVGLDDVREKLPIEQVNRLPQPSIILKSSLYSEQWLYILSEPEYDQNRIDNLHDGLIKNGLAPNSKDPGQKGVTRYLRLPEGVNTKAKRIVENGGSPPTCNVTEFHPERKYTLEQLAQPFSVDLNSARADKRIDGAADVSDHPVLSVKALEIKSVLSDGRFDCVCPWVDEHTDKDDSGTAIFTNADGTIGFKCHHGSCDHRNGKHLLQFIEEEQPGFGAKLAHWQAMRAFSNIQESTEPPTIDFTQPSEPQQAPVTNTEPESPGYQALIDVLRTATPFSDQARQMAVQVLKSVDSLAAIDKLHLHEQVRDIMRWSKPEFKQILDDLRSQWYSESKADISFFDEVVFIAEQNQFFDRKKRIFFTAEAYQNTYAHLDPEARKEALQGGRVTKVDRIDYAPKKPPVFEEDGITYGNSWFNGSEPAGTPGDVTRWLEHFKVLGWEKEMDHIIKWMAFTIRHPDVKINHMLILGSGEGGGKDWLLYPLMKAMGENHMTIDGEELLSSFDDYKLASKHLHINEVELGDHKEATKVSNKLKPLATAPPFRLRVNQKSIKPIRVRNILSVSMTTNSQRPVHLNGTSRRIFAVWSNLNTRDHNDEVLPEWREYWIDRWNWMQSEGADACIWYLKNVVDLSDFNPGAAPPMTDFLRDIAESSKTPLQQTLEAFIREEIDVFKCDIISTVQMEKCIKTSIFADGLVYVNAKFVSPIRIDQVLKGMMVNREARCKQGRVWVIRNHSKYAAMTDQQVFEEHTHQHQQCKLTTTLTAAN